MNEENSRLQDRLKQIEGQVCAMYKLCEGSVFSCLFIFTVFECNL